MVEAVIRFRQSNSVTNCRLIVIFLIAGCGQDTDVTSQPEQIFQAPVLTSVSLNDEMWINRSALDRIGFDRSIDLSRHRSFSGEIKTDPDEFDREDNVVSIQCFAELVHGYLGEASCFRHEGIAPNTWTPIHGEIIADFGNDSGLVSCLRIDSNGVNALVETARNCRVFAIVTSED